MNTSKKTKAKPRVYYAYCMKHYGSKRSKMHVQMLKDMGFEVIDPGHPKFEKHVQKMKARGKDSAYIMKFFVRIVKTCDGLAFSTAKTNTVSAGAWKEIETMRDKEGFVIQMPDLKNLNKMSVSATRKFLGR